MSLFDIFRGRSRGEGAEEVRRSRPNTPPRIVLRGYGSATGLHEAGDTGRLTASWTTHPVPVLMIVEQRWRILCARGREAANNADHGKRFLRLVRKNVVGPRGIVVVPTVQRADGSPDTLARTAILDGWAKWCREPEVTGCFTFRELQGLGIQTVARDGEVFVRRLRGRAFGPYRYQLQFIDPTRIPVNLRKKLSNGNRIRAGIEFTPFGRPVAYYVRHDTDDYLDGVDYAGERFQRIPADEMFHLFLPEMINQPRGLSWMGTALTRLHHLGKYETAAVINARVGASKMGFFEKDPEAVDVDDEDEIEEVPLDAEPGTFGELPIGYRFSKWDPQYPQGEFDGFVKACLRSISVGLGVSYASLSGDLSQTSYSSIRAGVLDERDEWMDLQEWFVDKLVRPIFEEFISTAVLAGAITIGNTPLRIERVEQYKRARFQPRRWAWVDPSKDVKAARDAQDGLMRSVSETIRDEGRDPDEVYAEIADERARWKELDIAQTKQAAAVAAAPADMEGEDAAEAEKE